MKENYCPNSIIKTLATVKMALIAAILLLSVGFNNAFAGVTITVPTLPIITGCSFPTAYSNLGDIIITETSNNDISVFGTLTLSAPANFEFSAGTGNVTFTAGRDISLISNVSITANAITFEITGPGITNLDVITISGIQVRGINAATGASNVTRTAGTSVIAGDVNGATHATFTSFLNSVSGGTIAAAQTICSGGDPASFTETVASTGSGTLTYDWKYSTNGYGTSLANTPTYDVPAGLIATTTYRRITTSTLNGVTCTASGNDIVVMINNVTGGTIASAQTICSGGDPVAFTESVASNGSGALTYDWRYSTNGFGTMQASTITYDVPTGLASTTAYRRLTISTLGGVACTVNSNDVIVAVNSVSSGTIASAQTICNGGDPAAFTEIVASTGSGTLAYDWRYSTNGYGSSLVSTATYDIPSGLVATTTYRRITTSTLNSVSCTTNSNDILVTVQGVVTGGTIGSAQTICSGGDPAAFTESIASGGSGTLTYDWKYSTNGYGSSLANTVTYDVPVGLAATTTYRRITTSTLGGVSCTANSNDIIVTINALTGGTISSSQTICSGGDPAAFTESVASTGSGTLTYDWRHSTNGYGTSLASTATYDVSAGLAATTTYRRITTSTLNGVSCTASSNDIIVTVNTVSGGTIASAQTICSGGDPASFTETVASTGSGTLTYDWKYSTNGYGTSLTNTATYDAPSGLAATTTYRRVTTSTLSAVTCTASSNDIVVTINTLAGGTIASSQTICSGGDPVAFTESAASSGSGTLTYDWKYSTNGFGTSLANTATYDVSAGLPATTTYRRITTSTLGGVACTANSNDIVVTVNSVSGGTIASAQTICNGGDPAAFTESVASTGSGTLTYEWRHSTDGYGTSLANTATYDVSAGLAASTTYRRITTSTLNGVSCTANSNDILVTVQGVVTGGTIGSAQTICSGGDPAAFTESIASGGSGTLTYDWKYSTNGYGSSLANTATYDVSAGLAATTTYRRITTSTLGGVSCAANSNDIIVTINALTGGAISSSQTVCSGGDPAAFTESVASTGSGTLTYDWKYSTNGYGTSLANTATYDVSSGLAATTTYRRITTSTLNGVSCTASSNDVIVTVNTASGGTIASAQTICSGGDPASFTETVASTGSGTLTYDWKYSTNGYGTSLTNTATYDAPSGLAATTTYRRVTTSTLSAVTCTASSNDIVVTINTLAGGTIASSQTICSGGDPVAFTESVASSGSGILTYDWKYSTNGFGTSLANTATYDVSAGLLATTTYRRVTTSTLGGVACTANSNDIVVTVNSVSGGTIASAQTICNGGDPAAFTESVASTGSGTLTYDWKYSTNGYGTSLANTATYDVSAGLAASTTYRRITTSTLNGVSCTANSNDILVTVQGVVTGGTIGSAQTICSGGDPAAFTESIASGGSGTLTYDWKYSTNGYGSSLANTATYDVSAGLAATTTYRRVTTSTLGGISCTANSNDITVTINALTGGTISSSQTVCSGGDPAAFTESVASTGSGTLTYDWKYSTNGYGTSLANTATYDVSSGLAATTTYRRITTSTLNGVSCTASSNDVIVTVNTASGGTIASAQTICSGGDPASFTETVASTGSGALTYDWRYSTNGYGTSLTNTATYDAPSGLAATTTYRRITISSLGSVTCSASSNDIIVTVQGVVTGGAIASSQTICSGGDPVAFTESVASSGSGTLTYDWKHSTNGYGTSLANTATYDVSAGLPVTTTYRRVTTSTLGGVACTANSNDIVVTVNSVSGGTIASAQTICNGGDPAAFTESVASTGSGILTYEWRYSTDGYGSSLVNTATYDIPSGLLASTTYRRITTSTLNGVSCTANSNDILVTVQGVVTGGTIGSAQTICSGGDPAAFTESIASGGSGTLTYDWKYSTNGYGSSLANTAIYDVSAGLAATTTYRRVTTSTLGSVSCSANSNDITVTINALTGGTISSSQTICSGGDPAAFTESVASTGSGTLTYDWKHSTNGYGTSLASTATYDVSAGLATTTTYRRITTSTLNGVSCTASSNDIIVTVNTASGGTIASAQTICSGGDPASFTETVASTGSGALTYDWRYSTNGYGTSLTNTATYDAPSGLAATTTYRRITISSLGSVTCSASSNDIIVTVQGVVTGGAIASSQTICSGGDPLAFTETLASGGSGTLTYDWKHSTNGYGTSLANTATYDVSAGLPVTTTYRRITTSTLGGVACTANSNDIVVTVNSVSGGTIASAQTICSGGDPAAFTESIAPVGSGTLTYDWRHSTDAYGSSLISTATYDIPSGLVATTTYRRTTISTLNGVSCSASSNDIIVTVNAAAGGAIASAQTICSGGDPAAFTESAAATGSGPLTYEWRYSTNSYGTNLASAVTYDVPSGLLATTTYRRITTSTLGGVSCTANSNDIIVTVQSTVTGGIIASSQTICSGDDPAAFTESVASAGSGTLTYDWKYSTNGYGTSLANTPTYDVSAGLTATTTYRRITTSTLNGVSCMANSNDIIVAINLVSGGSVASAQTICSGGDPAAFTESVASTGSGTLTYDWRYSTNGYGSTLVSGATYDVASGLASTTTFRRITISTLGGVSCSANSNDLLVTVNAPIGNNIISAAQTICNGAAPFALTGSVPTGGDNSYTYLWESSTTSGVSGFSSAAGTNSNPGYIPGILTVNTWFRRIVTSCTSITDVSGAIEITVNPIPVALATNNSQTHCSGTSFTTMVLSTSNGVPSTYTWTRDKTTEVTGVAASGAGNITGVVLTNTTTSPQTVTFTITPTGPNPTLCVGLPITATILVNPTPVLSSSLAPPAICTGTAFAYTAASTTSGSTFSWSRPAITNITPATNSGVGSVNEALTNTSASAISVTYAYQVSANGCLNSTIYNVVVVVNVFPILSSTLAPAAVCSGSPFSYTPASATSGTSFAWTRPAVAGISNAAGSGTNNPNEILNNTTSVTINVKYIYALSANGCSNPINDTVVVAIKPMALLSNSLTPPAVCSGTPFSYTPASLTSGATFAWARATVSGISNAAASGVNNPGETLINVTAAAVSVTYVYTTTAGGCSYNQNVIVLVNPSPTLSSSLSPPAICSGTLFSYTPISPTTGAVFTWTRSAISGISNPAASGTGNPGETLINTTGAGINVTYVFTVSANGCVNPSTFNVVVAVSLTPALSSSLFPPAICSGGTFAYTPTSGMPGTSFIWTRAAVAGISNIAGSGIDNPNELLTNTTAATINVVYVYTLSANGCANPTTYNVQVPVDPVPSLSSSLTPPAICSGTAFNYIPLSTTTGASYTWTRGAIPGISNIAGAGSGNVSEVLTNTTADPVNVTYAFTVSASGCIKNNNNVTVAVNPSPVLISTLAPAAVCSGAPFSYTPQSSALGATFIWTRAAVTGITNPAGNGTGSPNETFTNTTLAPINVTYVYTVSANGCTNSNTYNVVVPVNPVPLFTSSLLPPEVCSGTTFAYTPTSGTAGTSFAWTRAAVIGISNIGGSGINNPNEVLINTTLDSINVTYIYSLTANGCTNPISYSVVVTVNPTPEFTSTLSPSRICSGSVFNYVPTSQLTGVTFSWTRPDVPGLSNIAGAGAGTIAETLTLSDSAAVNVTYLFTVSTSLCTNGASFPVVLTVGSLDVNAGNDVTVSFGASVTLSGTGGISFLWSPVTGLNDPNIANPTLTAVSTITYVLTSTDGNSCTGIDSVTVTVLKDQDLIISSVMTPNGDGKNDTWIIVNIEDYPDTEVIVVNNQGQQVYTSPSYDNSWDGTFNGKPLPDATYYYFLKFAKGEKVYSGAISIFKD
ncbi:MAG: PKD-like domain-containing protein [Bacteroidota bacterium]